MGSRRTRILLGVLIALILIPLGLSALTAAALFQMLQVARTVRTDSPDSRVVEITSRDRLVLRAAWTTSPSFNGGCVLTVHGVGGWRARGQRFLPWLLPAGYSVLSPDMRAHGESGGDTVTYGLREQFDVLDWAAWMRQQGCQRVYGVGESMGASILILAAGQQPETFRALVAECAFADLLEAAEERAAKLFPFPHAVAAPLARLSVWGGNLYLRFARDLNFSDASPVHSIGKLRLPILLIHGLNDTRTPPSHSEALAAANPAYTQLWLVPGADHVAAYTTAPEEFERRVLAHLTGR